MADIFSSQSGKITVKAADAQNTPLSIDLNGNVVIAVTDDVSILNNSGNISLQPGATNSITLHHNIWPTSQGNDGYILHVDANGRTYWGPNSVDGVSDITAGQGLTATNTANPDGSTSTLLDVNAGNGIVINLDAVSHANTSSQTSVNNVNGVVIQDVTVDGFGHVTGLGSVNLDGRFVLKAGDTMAGNLSFPTGIAAVFNTATLQYNPTNKLTSSDTITAPSFNTSSALRYKTDVDYVIPDALGKVLAIDVIYYVAKSDKTKTRQLGVSAESVAAVAPEYVAFNDQGLPESVNYGQMTALLIAAMQEQEQRRLSNRIKNSMMKVCEMFKGLF